MSPSTAAFIAEQRALLDSLEHFAGTPDYQRLLAAVVPLAVGNVEPWLAEWLIRPAFGIGERPIDATARPGGIEVIEQLLMRIGAGMFS